MDRELEMAHRLAAEAAKEGGRVYFVGGYVRDVVAHRENKDVDVEVHGLLPAQLEAVLDRLGERTVMGASFGVYGLKHYQLDIAMPRRETKNGRGHRDFRIEVDPFIGTYKAAQRRDFTVNALMQDVLTGEIIDHFGGLEDLRAGVIRHVCDESFAEDPLRVLRAAQFAARFRFVIAPETRRLCEEIDLSALTHERIMAELDKALMKADRPSIFFRELRAMNQLSTWFAEIEALIGVQQEKAFHPEGDVFEHTMLVLDQAAKLRAQAAYPAGLMMAALCHDMGKPQATQWIDGRIRAFEHEKIGLPIARVMIERLSTEVRLKDYVTNMVELHMRPNALVAMNAGKYAYMKLFDLAVEPGDLLLLAEADHCGRPGYEEGYTPIRRRLQEMLCAYNELMDQPAVRGRDLIEAGVRPGPAMGQALAFAHKQHLRGVPKEQAMKNTLQYLREMKREAR